MKFFAIHRNFVLITGVLALGFPSLASAGTYCGTVFSYDIPYVGTITIDTATRTSEIICEGSIVAADIATGAVTEGKIANDAVTNPKISTGAVDTRTILDGSILTNDLADNIITTEKIADGR